MPDLLANILNSALISYPYLELLAIIVGSYLIFGLLFVFIIRRLDALSKKTTNTLDDFLVNILRHTKWPLYLIILLIATSRNAVAGLISGYYQTIIAALILYLVLKFGTGLIDYFTEQAKKRERMSKAYLPIFNKVGKIVLWLIAALILLELLGYEIKTLVAGLGIGGIAVALAVQSTLSDVLSSVSIYFDRPFKIGDFIVVGEHAGTVKDIGLKTTRITLQRGEELVVPNGVLTGEMVQNFGRMRRRRMKFEIGVGYDTSASQLAGLPDKFAKILDKIDKVEIDRIHFTSFGDSALIYEIVYYVASKDYQVALDIQQQINLECKKMLDRAKIEIAYPTQTIYMKKG